jgi:hypothetical protein
LVPDAPLVEVLLDSTTLVQGVVDALMSFVSASAFIFLMGRNRMALLS